MNYQADLSLSHRTTAGYYALPTRILPGTRRTVKGLLA